MILRSLSDTDYFFSRVDTANTSRPMLYKARQRFYDFKGHPAVAETQRLLYSASDIGGQLLQGVLYANELPLKGLRQEPADEYWKAHKEELESYMQLVDSFYREAYVGEFLELNLDFIKGAINEAQSYINDSATIVMEDYFGREYAAYKMFLMPMCPYGWGFSTSAISNIGLEQYAIIAPVKGIKWDGQSEIKGEYGFGGEDAKAHYRELVLHEFVHSFMTDVLERDSLKQQIAKYQYLYTPLLDSAMHEQGYSGWWSFVNELLVRAGHIRVASRLGGDEAAVLRKADVEDYGFILMPEVEEWMKEYEMNRDKYPSIDDFLPGLINRFSAIDTAIINSRLRK